MRKPFAALRHSPSLAVLRHPRLAALRKFLTSNRTNYKFYRQLLWAVLDLALALILLLQGVTGHKTGIIICGVSFVLLTAIRSIHWVVVYRRAKQAYWARFDAEKERLMDRFKVIDDEWQKIQTTHVPLKQGSREAMEKKHQLAKLRLKVELGFAKASARTTRDHAIWESRILEHVEYRWLVRLLMLVSVLAPFL